MKPLRLNQVAPAARNDNHDTAADLAHVVLYLAMLTFMAVFALAISGGTFR